MTRAELQEALGNILYSNLFLRLENDIFERYLTRRDPESLQSNFFLFKLLLRFINIFLFKIPIFPF